MSEHNDQTVTSFLQSVQSLLEPVSGVVTYGNVRMKVTQSRWEGDRPITNAAITYESPGGSTNQINVTYEHNTQQFRVLSASSGDEELFADPTPILQRIADLVQSIPQVRMDRLKWDLDRWINDGKTKSQLVSTLSRLSQADSGLKGGGITQDELKEAARYIAQRFKGVENKSDPIAPR